MDLKNARCVVVFDGDLDPGTPGIQPSRNLHTVGVSLLSECSQALSLEFASLDPDVKLRLRAVETVLQNPAWLLDSPSVIASYPQVLSLPKLCFELLQWIGQIPALLDISLLAKDARAVLNEWIMRPVYNMALQSCKFKLRIDRLRCIH